MTRERMTAAAQLRRIDAHGVRLVRGLPHPPIVTQSLASLSRATDHSDAWLAAALIGAAGNRARRAQWLNAGARVALVEMTSRAMKRAFPRRRPQLEYLPALAPTPSPTSFPSSHTAAAVVAVYAFGDELIPKGLLCPLAPHHRHLATVPRGSLPVRRRRGSGTRTRSGAEGQSARDMI